MSTPTYPGLGARPVDGGVFFRVWAPKFERVEVVLVQPEDVPGRAMTPEAGGYFSLFVPEAGPGTLYRYRVDGDLFPDPASQFQPEGVHGPSMVVDAGAYRWQDGPWNGVAWEDVVFYELHVGTFTQEGTFRGVQERLPYLRDLGVTALELMPVADFSGRWSWGYDQAALYAPSRAYGTPDDLRRLVDAAHQVGLAVFLDVIYNHLGPDGAYAPAFGPFFTDKHHTPWGQAVNLDDAGSEQVRAFFIENALHWLTEYHVDGLRLDATHALVDDSPRHFLAELTEAVASLEGRRRYLVAEDERNLRRVLLPREQGGYGLDGVWADDFHHQVRNLIAGDHHGYYADFAGTTTEDLAATLRQGWFFTGQYSSFLDHVRGTDPAGLPLDRFIICIQNHDQVGNRAQGNRLSTDVSPAAYRAATAVLLLAPETPLLFMGQEWGTEVPFQFFTDHHEELGRLVSEGRRKEFEAFEAFQGDVPDPQDPQTFRRSRLRWDELEHLAHQKMHAYYRDLLHLRKRLQGDLEVRADGAGGLVLRRGLHHLLVALKEDLTLPLPQGTRVLLHSEQPAYAERMQPPQIGSGAVHFAVPGAVVLLQAGPAG